MRENEQIRRAARVAGIPLWKIAAEIGVSEPTFMRWMRFPLPKEKEAQIIEAISTLEKEVS
ncbi:hypothetical protein [Flavonifractor plautii]|uniref:hypothetical protein n=1 Tax=Flavonifractor plautii TaxID=292800 RepID=UPI0024B88CAE|nr:hypothetical protein [Flavonifractor plautii]